MNGPTFTIDGRSVPFTEGQSIIQAAREAGIYIPHLCYHPEFRPHGSCRLCVVEAGGRSVPACSTPAVAGQQVRNRTERLDRMRRTLVELLFVEGNHFCPACPKSGNCKLQAVGYWLRMLDTPFPYLFPRRELDASHHDVLLDRDRCIFCELCVRASREVDRKNLFAIGGKGTRCRLLVNSPDGRLGSSGLSLGDRALQVCPTGALLPRKGAFHVPVGRRAYDGQSIADSDE